MIIIDDVILYRNPFENRKNFMDTVNESFYVIHANSKGAFFALEDFMFHWEHFTKPIE